MEEDLYFNQVFHIFYCNFCHMIASHKIKGWMSMKMNIARKKISPNHFLSLYCQRNCTHYGHISQFHSLGIPRLELENPRWNSYVGHWNSYVRIPMSNVGIPTWVFSFLPRFSPNLMIFIIWMNLSSFIGTIYIEKSSNLSKIWAEMRKPTLEFLRWTLEFRRRNSNVQRWNSNVGFPTPT